MKDVILAENLRATIDGIEYRWFGGFGNTLESRERGVKKNECRMMGGRLLVAWKIERRFIRRSLVMWTIPNATADDVRQLRNEIFGVAEPGGVK